MVLHTSGTTSRPEDRAAVAAQPVHLGRSNIARTLQFTASRHRAQHHAAVPHPRPDRRRAGTAGAGSQVFCTPGFNALKFFGWMDEAHPTWYTAVPTMHQAILGACRQEPGHHRPPPAALHPQLSSSSMPPQVIRELEEAFGAPLIEAYGMTEATHQMASNPCRRPCASPAAWVCPPAPRWPSWPRTAACCHAGGGRDRDPRRQRHRGYESNPKANAEASPPAGSAPATRARWMPTATSA
jgi:hypothetical protein